MRAALYRSLGDPDVIETAEIDTPTPGPGEVRVKVVYSAVNPTDWKARRGSRGPTMPFPYVVPNQDGTGVIDMVGTGVDQARVGQRVWIWFAQAGRQHGTAAEWVTLPEHLAVPLPDSASFELGACLGVPAMTAHRALFWDGPIGGSTVLVSGGAGAVGHYAIQLAKRAGARVITTVSSDEKADLATAAGADAVVNYRDPGPLKAIRTAAPGGIDRFVEVALGANLDLDLDVAAPGATIVSYATTRSDPAIPVSRLMFGNVTLRFMLLYGVPTEALTEAVEHVTGAVADGTLTPLPLHRFDLAGTAQAHAACETGIIGKAVIVP
ncbi:MAG: NADPH:quinone reductase [Acidimicrobiia bacterium]|nr:NADPH:quinone reductase [Acidimicrobiia bacterium]MDH4305998.1 NADPH:quinone reductase [Acidimicrobiia bacterium]